jgi:hypothetical protein
MSLPARPGPAGAWLEGAILPLTVDGFPNRDVRRGIVFRLCPVVWEGWHREMSPYPD